MCSHHEMERACWLLVRSGLFDRTWYEAQTGRLFGSRQDAVDDYLTKGWPERYSPHPLVDLKHLAGADWEGARSDPLSRYLTDPGWHTRQPHPFFDPIAYLARVPSGARHRFGPLAHFVAHAGKDDPLPLPRRLAAADIRWGWVRRCLLDQAAQISRQQRQIDANRIVRNHDWAADRAFVQAWSSAAVRQPDLAAPTVSVIMPVLDRDEQVRIAIESLRAQSLASWELLLVADGRSDPTAQLVAELAASDQRIRLIRTDHVGDSHARNVGTAAATGRYLTWLDTDHAWVPHFLQVMVAAMQASRLPAAYAGIELMTARGPRYATFDVDVETLEVINDLDLNAFVVERALLDQVGPFDESMRRMADYDLLWRLLKQTRVEHLPFVGVRAGRAEDSDRNTAREARSWRGVAKNKSLIDWPALQAAIGARKPDRTSVVIHASLHWRRSFDLALAALHDGPDAVTNDAGGHDAGGHDTGGQDTDTEVIIFDDAHAAPLSLLLAAVSAMDPRVSIVRSPVRVGRPLGRNLAFARSTGARIVFVDSHVEARQGWLIGLAAPLADPTVLATQPLLLELDGTIDSAGGTFAPGATFPSPFLAGLPAADAERLGPRIEVPAILGTPLCVRAGDVVGLRGFDPLLLDGWDDVDLSLRLGAERPGRLVVATGSVARQVRMPQPRSTRPAPEPGLGERTFQERWTGRVPAGDDSLWRSAGFEVLDRRADDELEASADFVRPVLRWMAEPPVLRWAIKTSIPADARGRSWGDLFFAQVLADALRQRGPVVAIDAREAVDRESAAYDDVVLVLRGLETVVPHPGKINLLWVISHPELVSAAELAAFDHVFAASTSWAEKVAAGGQDRVTALLQATDPQRFRPEVAIPDTGHRLLFVGNSRREVYRPSVRHLIEAGADVAIYGRGWEQFVDPRYVKGQQIPNDQLAAAYRSAGVVLNDHWDDMRESGFMSNRLFDAVAAGARVISDDIAGSEETFGAAVRTYRSPEELIRLATSPVRDLFPTDERLVEISRRIRSEHSFDRRAAVLLETALKLRGATGARVLGTR